MKKTRILALLLAVMMVAALFAACTGTEPETTTTEATTEATTTEATTEAKLDFGGRTVTLTSAWIGDFQPKVGESDFDDKWQAVYTGLENDLNIKIELVAGPHQLEDAIDRIMSGDYDELGDICDMKLLYWVPCAINGYIAQLNTPEIAAKGLDVTDSSAFFQPYTSAMNLGGKIYAAQWNGSYAVCEFGWCMFVNLDYLSEYGGVSDIFQTVRDMKWNWETFLDLQQKCCKDTDGDGNIDIWGSGEHSYGQEIYTIPGGATVYIDENGKYTSGLLRPATQEALQFAQNYFNSGYCETSTGYGDIHRKFTAGEVAMQWGEQWNTAPGNYFDAVDVNYGIIPIPKHSTADKYTNILGGVRAKTLYLNNTKFDENVKILYAFGKAFTDDAVWDTFLEKNCMGNKYSLEMVQNYIWGDKYAQTVTDYSWADWDNLQQWYRNNVYFPIVTGSESVASVCEAQNSAFQAAIDAAFKQ